MNLELTRRRLDDLYRKSGMTQQEIAHKIGVHTNSINGWIGGYRAPNAAALIKLAKLFNVSVDYLLGLSDIK